jgi:branched-chain amino acid transport system substrate-binding protein
MSQINIPAQTTHYSLLEDCHEAARRLKDYLREWFNQLPWRELRVRIEERVRYDESVQVIFHTENIYLKKLPWHLWDLFETREYAQFTLSAEYARPSAPLKHPVRILAIFGGSQGLNLQPVRRSLQELRRQGAIVQLLENPRREQLNNGLWEQHWDILFFAGHSRSLLEGHSGEIQINDTETLSVDRLRNALRTAVRNGLKLAIFNSCDGLGLAAQSTRVGVPQVIVMREPVPDEVAQRFLQYFLSSFSSGKSFYLAVREARERLEVMEDDNPCASWLPIICQNPAAKPLLWPKKLSRFAKRAVVAVVAIALAFLFYKMVSFQPNSAIKDPSPPVIAPVQALPNNFSQGEKILLLGSNTNPDKEVGVKAFAANNFPQAIQDFQKSLKKNSNDPETLIYLNNAVSHEPTKIKELPVPKSVSSKTCSVSQSTQNPLNVAVSVPIGTDSPMAQEILRGVAQAQNEINCTGGINGKLLQVTIADDEGKPDLAEKVAQKLVEMNILGAIGHSSSGATLKAGKMYDKKLVVISPTSTAIRYSKNNSGLDFSEYVFRTPTSDAIAIEDLIKYMVQELGYTKAAIVFDPKGPYSNSFALAFQRQLESKGGQVVDGGNVCHLGAYFNAHACVTTAIAKQAQVLLLVPELNQADQALQIFNANKGSQELRLLGGDVMYSHKILGQGQAAEHLVVAVPWYRKHSNPSQFERDAQSLWGTIEVNWRTATAYDATQVIAEGLRRISKDNPTRQELKRVLSASDFSAKGATGKVEFDETGDRKVDANTDTSIGVLVEVQPARQSQYGHDFVLLQQ